MVQVKPTRRSLNVCGRYNGEIHRYVPLFLIVQNDVHDLYAASVNAVIRA